MELKTERLKIVPCTEDAVPMITNQNYDNGNQIPNHLKELSEDPSMLYWGTWLVLLKSDGTIIGDIGFKGKPDENKAVEIGYGLLEEYWNKGFATEAVGALMQWAWETGKVDKIVADTLRDNEGSMRVLEKLNMKKIKTGETMIDWEINKA